jgi:carbamate kinase
VAQRLVISLGGNAFARSGEALTMAGQFAFAARTLAPLGALLASDTQLLVTHGNGPQVGFILTRVEEALGKAYRLPLEVCVAESEGEIGYVLQQTLHNTGRGRRPGGDRADPGGGRCQGSGFRAPASPSVPWFDPPQADTLAAAGVPLLRDER